MVGAFALAGSQLFELANKLIVYFAAILMGRSAKSPCLSSPAGAPCALKNCVQWSTAELGFRGF